MLRWWWREFELSWASASAPWSVSSRWNPLGGVAWMCHTATPLSVSACALVGVRVGGKVGDAAHIDGGQTLDAALVSLLVQVAGTPAIPPMRV